MKKRDIARAWRDAEYRESLGEGAEVPAHPSGAIELPDSVLAQAVGGNTEQLGTMGCCQGLTDGCTDTGETCASTDSVWCCTVTTRRRRMATMDETYC